MIDQNMATAYFLIVIELGLSINDFTCWSNALNLTDPHKFNLWKKLESKIHIICSTHVENVVMFKP